MHHSDTHIVISNIERARKHEAGDVKHTIMKVGPSANKDWAYPA